MSFQPTQFPPEVASAIARGNKLEAIRLLRELSGLSLVAAKAEVERFISGIPSTSMTSAGAALSPEVLAALAKGNKIEAIKLYRLATGLGLKEAKDMIDAYEGGASNAMKALAPGEVPRGSRAAWWLWLLVALGALAGLVYWRLG